MIKQNANKSNKIQEDFVMEYQKTPAACWGWLSERQTGIVAHGHSIGDGFQQIEQLPI